jgi:hypothetical protein
VGEHRDSIPKSGAAGQPSHILHRRCAYPAPPTFEVTVATVAPMAKKDAASKRLAEVSGNLPPVVRRLLSDVERASSAGPAVRWLLSELERASSAVPASPENERARYIHILVTLSKFVRKVGGTIEQSRHIYELAQLLADLDDGIVGRALERARFGKGKTGDSSLVWEARGSVAMGLEALIRLGTGKSRKDAAKFALRDLPGISRLMTAKSKKNSVAAMLSWHDEFLRWQAGKGRIKNRYLAGTFDTGLEGLKLCAGSPTLLRRFAQLQFARASRI